MRQSEIGRPAFLIRRLLRDAGSIGAYTSDGDWSKVNARLVGGPESAEALWSTLEKVIVLLNLAGWEVREVLAARPWGGDAYYATGAARLDVHGQVDFDDGDWRALTGASLAADAMQAIGVRVSVRRTLGAPSPYPPIALDDIPGYAAVPDLDDPFHDARDGWITLGTTTADLADVIAGPLFAEVGDALIRALVTAWTGAQEGMAVGMLRSLDPSCWDSALDRVEWVWPFDVLAAEIWAWLSNPAQLEAFLRLELDDKDARTKAMAKAASAGTSLSDAIAAMEARAALLHPNHASLGPLLARLRSEHWILALMRLHEYGLICILPFPLPFEPQISGQDITGTYETRDEIIEASGRPINMSMQLVQAGDQVRGCWYDEDLDRWDLVTHIDLSVFDPATAGPSDPMEFFGAFTHAKTGVQRTARLSSVPQQPDYELELIVQRGADKWVMRRTNQRACMDPSVMEAFADPSAAAGVLAALVPIHSRIDAAIDRAVERLIAGIESISATTWSGWSIPTMELEGDLETMLEDDGVLTFDAQRDPVPSVLLDRFRTRVRLVLPTRTISSAGGVDAWTQLFGIFEVAGASSAGLQRLLGLSGSQPHKYTYRIHGVGAAAELAVLGGVELGGFAILFSVTHDQSCAPPSTDPSGHGWSAYYLGKMLVGGGSVGPEAKVDATFVTIGFTDNDLYSSTEWTKDDFVGAYFATIGVDVHGQVFYGPGASLSVAPLEGYVFFNGSKGAVGSGNGVTVNLGAGMGGGYGGGLGGNVGKIMYRLDNSLTPIATMSSPPPPRAVWVSIDRDAEFAVDSAELSDAHKVLLQSVICRYRALLEQPGASILIEADASPSGSEAYNEELSWRRALSIYAHLRSLLSAPGHGEWGPAHALAIPPNRVAIIAYGELRARLEGIVDGVEDSDWRRAKLLICDTVMVML